MFEQYSSTSTPLDLVNAIVTDNSLEIVPDSIIYIGGDGQTSFYDGSLTELGIGAGILLTSGDGTPPSENTMQSFSKEQQGNSDQQLQDVADSAFAGNGGVLDVNSLEFSFNISNPHIESISFDLLFGSDEFEEFSNTSYVDIAAVFVNDHNVALFNNDTHQPLSIIDTNLELGNFRDNRDNTLPIEYDGISSILTIVAPVHQGENTIRFAVADTGDTIYDSGLFVANLAPNNISIDDDDNETKNLNSSLVSLNNGKTGIVNSSGLFTSIIEGITFFDIALSSENELFGTTSAGVLYEIDLESSSFTKIGSLNVNANVNGLAFGGDNLLYGTGYSNLYTIDIHTGKATLVANLDSDFSSSGDLVFDPTQNVFYATSTGFGGFDFLYSISLTGETTEIGGIGFNNVYGLSIENGHLTGFANNSRIIINPITGEGVLDTEIEGIYHPVYGGAEIYGASEITSELELPVSESISVYEFFRTDTQTRFYTTEEAERDAILENLPQYELQGVSFFGATISGSEDDIAETSAVYRFFNTSTGVHFYTADENEAAFVANNLHNYVFEGTPYHAYSNQVEGTVPLYRFYNSGLDAHFYTTSIEERDFFAESSDYVAENGGIYYVEPPTEL